MPQITPLNYSFLIAGIEILPYVLHGTKIALNRGKSSGDTAELYLSAAIDDVLTIQSGQEIIISRGVTTAYESYKFKGEIKAFKFEHNMYVVTCKNKIQQLKYQLFTRSYDINIDDEAGEYSAIFKDIVENGGFAVSTEDSGTGLTDFTAEKFIARRSQRLERMTVIAKILDWVFYYDYDNDWIRFEPRGYSKYANTLETGVNVYNSLKWREDLEQMRNKITIEGVFQLDKREESETGDGATTAFTFEFTPEGTECTVDGTLQKRGIVRSTETYDYTVDRENKTYTFGTAPVNLLAIVMKYDTKIPTPIKGNNSTSQTKYDLVQEDAYNFDDVVTIDDAETRLSQLLDILGDAEVSTSIFTNEYTIKPGQKIDVIDNNTPARSGEYTVYEVIINYPEVVDVIKIGTDPFDINDLFTKIHERLRSLEIGNQLLEEILSQIISFVREYTYERRYFKLVHKDRSSDTTGVFILNHPTFGVLGTQELGDDNTTETDIRITQGNNKYKEFLYDTDFIDTSLSTATVNTTTKQVEF